MNISRNLNKLPAKAQAYDLVKNRVGQQLFRYTGKTYRKAVGHHQNRCSLREAERLKHTPVSGAITWYKVTQDENGANIRADSLFICAPKSGDQVTLTIPENYPESAPIVTR